MGDSPAFGFYVPTHQNYIHNTVKVQNQELVSSLAQKLLKSPRIVLIVDEMFGYLKDGQFTLHFLSQRI